MDMGVTRGQYCAVLLQSQEALRRAKFKFAGRQKIVVSRNWGFTRFARSDYVAWKKSGRLINDGVNAKVQSAHVGFSYRGSEKTADEKGMKCVVHLRLPHRTLVC